MGKIIIGGDCVPTKNNYKYFINGEVERLVGNEIKEIFANSAYNILNLEVPLCDLADPIDKCGPNLIAPTRTISGFRKLGVNLVALANNHILDQGEQGLVSTIKTLDAAGIYHVGAGKDINKAQEPFLFNFANRKVGVYACAEHEFSIVSNKTMGANPFDPLYSLDHIANIKKKVDFLIVLYHGGIEHYRYPSPYIQKICRKVVEKGADVVICQHSHCIGCEEKYQDGVIIYGQGNFLFDNSISDYWKTSLLVTIDESLNVKYVPIVKYDFGVRIADSKDGDMIIKQFNERSNEIKMEGFVENTYSKFACQTIPGYIAAMAGYDKKIMYRVINKIFDGKFRNLCIKRLGKRWKLRLINYFECEAHKEICIQGLKDIL